MNCSVCKNAFIISKTREEFMETKRRFEEKFSKIIDEMNEEEFSMNCNELWNKIMHKESLQLRANIFPKKCPIENCCEYICDFCYNCEYKCSGCNQPRVILNISGILTLIGKRKRIISWKPLVGLFEELINEDHTS